MPSSNKSGVRIRKPGCSSCQKRHLKCDRELPTCSNCRKARRRITCEYSPPVLKVRHVDFPGTASNTGRGRRSQSVEETIIVDGPHRPLPREYRASLVSPTSTQNIPPDPCDSRPDAEQRSSDQIHWNSRIEPQPTLLLEDSAGEVVWPTSLEAPALGLMAVSDPRSPATAICGGHWKSGVYNEASHEIASHSSPHDQAVSTSAEPVARSTIRMVVSNSVDAKAFGFYVSRLAGWIDIVSPQRYFEVTVPTIALTNKALYYACLTYASRVLVRHGDIGKNKASEYEDTAISALIPQLSMSNEASQREALFTTTVILRMAEQFSEAQDDARCHLIGASSLFTSGQEGSYLDGPSYWLYARQSIRAAFMNEEPCKLDLDSVRIEFTPATEDVWTNRMVILLARACSVCWDTARKSTPNQAALSELHTLLELWRQGLPETFQPWCEYHAEDEPFPVIRYISPWHTIAWQFYYTAKVLVSSQKKPDCNDMIAMSRYMEAEILSQCRQLCAITFSCDNAGCWINGTHLVSWCGQFISRQDEQMRILAFLQNVMEETAWPNQTCCDRLSRIWSGESDAWVPRA